MTYHPTTHRAHLIYPPGTQVVALVDVIGGAGRVLHPRGAVGVVTASPVDLSHSYRVRFLDGVVVALQPGDVMLLALYKEGLIGEFTVSASRTDLFQRIILSTVIGSQAYGLSGPSSDVDRRGVYLPPAELHWSLYGVPEQLEREETQEAYWELQKFVILALKANPNALECLYTPLIEFATPLGEELLKLRASFLSRLVYQTYNGYVTSQFKKMQADLRNQGAVKWKHVMHLIRLLLSGIHVLKTGEVPASTPEHEELRDLARRCVTRHHAHHYLGFVETQWKLFQKESPPKVKPLLYVYRVLLTGIHLMRTGEVEANLLRLNEEARLPYIDELVSRKVGGPELGRLEAADLAFHEQEFQRLRAELEASYQASKLPEKPAVERPLHDLLVRLRMKGLPCRA